MQVRNGQVTVVVVLMLIKTIASASMADMVAYYPFDETGGTTIRDASGNGHDGSVVGNVAWVDGKSQYGKAAYFNGRIGNGHIRCGTWNPSEETGQLTVAFWVRWDGPIRGVWQGIIAKRINWDKNEMMWHVEINEGDHHLIFGQEGCNTYRGGRILPKGKWSHVTGTFDGKIFTFYINGKEMYRTEFWFGSKTDAPICIGASDPNGWNSFHGVIDEVCIFDTALSKNEVSHLYNVGGAPFASPALHKLFQLIQRAQTISKQRSPQKAAASLEKMVTEYERWKKKHPRDISVCSQMMGSDLHFQLAKLKELSGAPPKIIANLHMKSASLSPTSQNYVPALQWLFKNVSRQQFAAFVKTCLADEDDLSGYPEVARRFEATGEWSAFELYIESAFSMLGDKIAFAAAIEKGLNREGSWSPRFLALCRSKPELARIITRKYEEQARELSRMGKLMKAFGVYRELADMASSNPEKKAYELESAKCLFEDGQYNRAISALDNIIDNSTASDSTLSAQAKILKGRAYMHLDDMDRAFSMFLELALRYPAMSETSEAHFYNGYCNMLERRHDQAREAFAVVLANYPQSPFAGKARLCLQKLERITN